MWQHWRLRMDESKRAGRNRRCQRVPSEGDWSHQVDLLHEERHVSRL